MTKKKPDETQQFSDWDPEALKAAIDRIDAGVAKLLRSGISKKALLVLLQHAAPAPRPSGGVPYKSLTQKEILSVLDGLQNLRRFVLGDGKTPRRARP